MPMEPLALASPTALLPILYYKLCPRPRSKRGHPPVISPLTASTQYQWNHTVSSPHTTSPPTHPAPNSHLTYGVIRLPAGGSSQNLDPSMWSGTLNWSHSSLLWTYMVQAWPQTLGPATMAPYRSRTQYNH